MGSNQLASVTDFIRTATHTAHHFGFHSLDELAGAARAKGSATDRPKILAASRRLDALQGALTGGASAYFDHNLQALNEPAMFYTVEPTSRGGDVAFALHVVGIEKSIAEALLMHAVRSLYQDLGITEYGVRINSLGDRESLARFNRELGNYLKKRIEFLPPQARELMKEHVFLSLLHLIEREHELGAKSPSPLEYLNEGSRKHFREIIEYLDFISAPYEIDTKLLGHHQCYSQTIFAIDAYTEGRTERIPHISARGGRYDEFINQVTKKQIPAAGVVVTLHDRKAPARMPRHKTNVPLVFMVQLGFGPKLRSLEIIDDLKRANIPVRQALASDSLSMQLERARNHGVPFTIILGQKEYVENTVIVRDMRSSSQESVPVASLVSHLRKHVRA
jgi:histidyl-tRNA synthetase